jgi:hypothetical protein
MKPHLITRLFIFLFVCFLAFIKNNPIVLFQARLGLSPPPIERFFGFKSLFSGMTEGVHQFIRLNVKESIQANVFSPIVFPVVGYFILMWKTPKIDTKFKEVLFFSVFVLLSIIVNIVN